MSFSNALQRHNDLFNQLSSIEDSCQLLAGQIHQCFQSGGKLLFMGNGGSAADSQHLVAEFVVRYQTQRTPLPAIALTVNTSILTAHSNDFGFATVFTRQIQALCRSEDLVIGISTSGNSANVVDAIATANELGAVTWAWTGATGGKLNGIAHHMLCIPHTETARIQEAHIFIGHWLCEEMDRRFAER